MFFRIKSLNFVKVTENRYQALIFSNYIFEIQATKGTYSVVMRTSNSSVDAILIADELDTFIKAKRACRLFLINLVKEILEKE